MVGSVWLDTLAFKRTEMVHLDALPYNHDITFYNHEYIIYFSILFTGNVFTYWEFEYITKQISVILISIDLRCEEIWG